MLKRLAIAALVLAVIALAGGAAAWKWWDGSVAAYESTSFGDAKKEEVLVEIPRGTSLKKMFQILSAAGVVQNADSMDERRFLFVAKRGGFDRKMKTGEFAFQLPMTPAQVLEQISRGKVKLHQCTIPEGLRMDEIAGLISKCGYGSPESILAVMKSPKLIEKAGLKERGSVEGYLWPDTYSFPKGATAEAFILKMVSRFEEEYAKADKERGEGITLDKHQAATLASIVEKETGAPEERRRISCVFHNRLKKDMKLQTDPTVIYAKILRTGSFDGTIRRADLEFVHPYNTYTVKGLPPGPIASAGRAALTAALNPIECSDLYFVACGSGAHQFCPDYECHKKWVEECQIKGRRPLDAAKTAASAAAPAAKTAKPAKKQGRAKK